MRVLFLALLLWAAVGESREGRLVGVVDGDTIKVEVVTWPWPELTAVWTVRLIGVDAPELRGACDGERAAARRARDALLPFIGRKVRLTGIRPDKYPTRIDARVRLRGVPDLSEWLLEQGLARRYAGSSRAGWCPGR